MHADSELWKEVTPSPFPHEREALEFVRSRLPDHEPYRAWSNFEFRADDGSLNEVDLLVLSPKGCFLVEIKSWPGEIRGDWSSWVWTHEGRVRTVDNPLPLTNKKAKRLKSLLQRQNHKTKASIPFIEPLIFLSNETVEVKLDSGAQQGVFTRDHVMAALTAISPEEYRSPRFRRLDKPTAKALVRALDLAGIRKQTRKVGDYRLGSLLLEGPNFQDWEGTHVQLEEVKKRVRVYTVASAANAELRGTIRRAAEREFRVLQGIDHPGILRAEVFTESELGPALVFDHDPDALRLDHYLREVGERLDVDQRLDLLRQIAEALKYAHGKRLIHRALSPQSILVREKVASGLYNNQSEVVREGLRLLVEQDRLREAHLEKLRAVLAAGLVQADRGVLLDGSEAGGSAQRFKERSGHLLAGGTPAHESGPSGPTP